MGGFDKSERSVSAVNPFSRRSYISQNFNKSKNERGSIKELSQERVSIKQSEMGEQET